MKRLFRTAMSSYGRKIEPEDPVWQAGFYDFNIYGPEKLQEKLTYMHPNPVTRGLVARATDWPWSAARHYEQGRSVGVPVGWLD
jgi:putative transposase